MCDNAVAEILSALEAGSPPFPLFFSAIDCGHTKWPVNPQTDLPLSLYGTSISRSYICPAFNQTQCPVPILQSMSLAPNLKITFFANVTDNVSQTTPPIVTRVKEIGQTALYSNTYVSNGFIRWLGDSDQNNALTWFSSQCNGESKGCNTTTTPDNCQTIIPAGGYFDTSDGKLLRSMISCNSPLYPSFTGLNTSVYYNGSFNFSPCVLSVGSDDTNLNGAQDYCLQGVHPTLELKAYQSAWGGSTVFCPPTTNAFIQACSCIANDTEATNNHDSVIPPADDCGPNACGRCRRDTGDDTSEFTCLCQGLYSLNGSIDHIRVDLVNNENQIITWEELQVLWCSKGVSIGNIAVSRYQSGSPACDDVMRLACSKTAELTTQPELLIQCGCILEERRLRAQFAGIDLPSECFTTVCNLDSQAYRTKNQLEGCSARICEQALTIVGSNILSQGFQEVLCNATVYDVEQFSSVSSVAGSVPFVSQAAALNNPTIQIGPTFWICIAVLILLLFFVIIWVVRRVRVYQAQKRAEREALLMKFETKV